MSNENQNNSGAAVEPYKLFDGFIESNIAMKILYIATLPSLVVPILIEGSQYRDTQNKIEQRQDKMLQEMQSFIQQPVAGGDTVQSLNKNLTEAGNHFQDLLAKQKSAAAEHSR